MFVEMTPAGSQSSFLHDEAARSSDEHGRASATTRLAVVDDHSIIRGVFATLAEDASELSMIWSASCLAEARRQVQRTVPDLLVMDVNLPDGNGFEFVKELRKDLPDLSVLMISASHDAGYARQARECGAKGYLVKYSSVERLVEAMSAIQHGGSWFADEAEA